MLNVEQYKFEDSLEFELYDPIKNEMTGAKLTAINPQLPEYQKRVTVEREHNEDFKIAAVCAAVTGWSGIGESKDGKETSIPYSEDMARTIFGNRHNSWIVDQVYAVINRRSCFLANAS